MANLKQTSPRFKDVSGGTENGGAPIFSEDIIRLQENSSADTINFYEATRRLLPEILTWNGAANVKQFENGIILSGCEYDNTDPANPVLSEGFILSGGEVCYFAGGVFNTGGIIPGLLFMYKGSATPTSRVFKDGGNKEILVQYSVTSEIGLITPNGLELNGSTAITATDEVVVLQIGGGTFPGGPSDDFKGEDYCTMRAGLASSELGNRLTQKSWVAATSFLSGVTLGSTLPYLVSRVDEEGYTEVKGSINIEPSAQSGSPILACTLGSYSVNSGNTIPLQASPNVGTQPNTLVGVNLNGSILVYEPSGGWPGVDYEIVFNAKVYGLTSLETPYTYKNDFLNIT